MMDYHNFEEEVHAIVLERGEDYFKQGHVHHLEQTPSGWKATVQGTEEYEVTLNGTDGLEAWICNCPHDHGPVCKHVTAVLYAIRDQIKIDFGDYVNGLSEQQLRDIVQRELMRSREFVRVIKDMA